MKSERCILEILSFVIWKLRNQSQTTRVVKLLSELLLYVLGDVFFVMMKTETRRIRKSQLQSLSGLQYSGEGNGGVVKPLSGLLLIVSVSWVFVVCMKQAMASPEANNKKKEQVER